MNQQTSGARTKPLPLPPEIQLLLPPPGCEPRRRGVLPEHHPKPLPPAPTALRRSWALLCRTRSTTPPGATARPSCATVTSGSLDCGKPGRRARVGAEGAQCHALCLSQRKQPALRSLQTLSWGNSFRRQARDPGLLPPLLTDWGQRATSRRPEQWGQVLSLVRSLPAGPGASGLGAPPGGNPACPVQSQGLLPPLSASHSSCQGWGWGRL